MVQFARPRAEARACALVIMALFYSSCTEQPSHAPGSRVGSTTSALTTTSTINVTDTYVTQGLPNQNHGGETTFRLQSWGKNRGLLFIDPAAIRASIGTGTLVSASMKLQIADAGTNWGATGRPVSLHRLKQASAEYSATWACAVDATTSNRQADCSGATAWTMASNDPNAQPWSPTATATTTITNDQTGEVSFDVTADVAAIVANSWAGYGWLLKKVDENQNGGVEFRAHEQGEAAGPQLVLDVQGGGFDAGVQDAGPTLSTAVTTNADTDVRQWSPNQNFGSSTSLRIQALGRNRVLVNFDEAAIRTALGNRGLVHAQVHLTISQTFDNWGPDRAIGIHRLRGSWTESGATWNCKTDSDPSNSSADCSGQTEWAMWNPTLPQNEVAWEDPPLATALISSGQTGMVTFDVTTELACELAGFQPFNGFLVKKEAEQQSGRIEFASRETANAPVLIVDHREGSGVAITASQCAAMSGGGGTCTPTGVSEATCNGNDDDCDGRIDEAYAITATQCGQGACRGGGELSCVNGVQQDSCVPGNPAAADATCDGIDDNCNGSTDEGYLAVGTSCGVGACARAGTTACVNGVVVDSCEAGAPSSSDTTCDGFDDDCNGLVDDGYLATPVACVLDGCNAQGQLRCVSAAVVDDCETAGVCVSEANCGDGLDNDHDGAPDCSDVDCNGSAGCAPPPDPATIAPPIDASAGTPFYDLFSFLTEGADPIQRDVAPAAITRSHVALVQGHIGTRSGGPLAGVMISVVGHPELGMTHSRSDGEFDLLVEAGAELLVRFEHAGYVTVDRASDPVWRGAQRLDDVVLTPTATDSTLVNTSGTAVSYQLARGSAETDRDGSRRATLLFPPGTEAQLRPPAGAVAPQSLLGVRITELTVGPAGSNAMPGPLPGASAFMYAVTLTADAAPGGTLNGSIELSQPVPLYVENFLALPIGTELPAGLYDQRSGTWMPATSGIVIGLVGVQSGIADVDTNGDGLAESPSELAALGIGVGERAVLANLYAVGQSMWRVPLSQLGTWDISPGPGPLPSALAPPRTNVPTGPPPRHIVDVDVPVAGTDMTLHYSSDRVLGYGAQRHLDIDLGAPAALATRPHHARLSIVPSTGGAQSFRWLVPGGEASSDFRAAPLPVDRVFRWDWSGLDLAQRPVQGAAAVDVTLSYEYACGYRAADAFGHYAGGPVLPVANTSSATGTAEAGGAGVDRGTCLLSQRHTLALEQWDQREIGLGGFSLSTHHISLPDGSVLFGDGSRSTAKLMPVSRTLADPLATQPPPFNAVPLDQAAIWTTGAVRAAGDGSLYVAGAGPYLHRVSADGLVTTIANGSFSDLAILPDGDVAATEEGRIVRIDVARGTVTQLNAGGGAFSPDGTAITAATLEDPRAIATDAAGRIFFSDCGSHPLVRMIDVDGRLSTVAGNGVSGSPLVRSRVDARSIALSCVPAGALEVDNTGDVFFAEEAGNRSVLHVDRAGQVVMIGGYDACSSPECYGHPAGLELDRKGNIYVAERYEASVYRYTPGDPHAWTFGAGDETREWVYGKPGELTDPRCNRPAGTPASAFFAGTRADTIHGIAMSSDGSLYVAESCHTFRSSDQESLPADAGYLRARRLDPATKRFVPSPDGTQYHVFDANGRHLETRDASTNGLVRSFGYDSAGRIAQVVDADGNATLVVRDAAGAPTAIRAPFGQETALQLDANGYLASIQPDPSVAAYAMQYADARGLLRRFTTPRGTSTRYDYDALGLLASTTDPISVTRQFTQQAGASARTSTQTGPSGTTTVAQQRSDDGRETRVATAPDGVTTVLTTDNVQHDRMVHPDGTTIERIRGEDARWGAAAPVTSETMTMPSGLRLQQTTTTSASLALSSDPTTATIVRAQRVRNGATWDSTIDLNARTRTLVSPEGRVQRVTSDAAGRPVLVEQSGKSPIHFAYDEHGRIASIVSGVGADTRATQYGYSTSSGYLESVSDGAGDASFARDALGRVTGWTRPDGHVVAITYDPNGDVISVTPPEKPAHGFSYTPAEQVEDYSPPATAQSAATSTVYEYTPAGQLARVLLPDGRTLAKTYRPDGKLATVTSDVGTVTYTYSPSTGGLRVMSDASGATLSFGYDGHLPNIELWDGAGHVRGWVTRGYDTNFQVASLGVNGATLVSYTRDADGFLTGAGPMQISRDPATGSVSDTTLGDITSAEERNGRGELDRTYTAYQDSMRYGEELLARDGTGRITLRRDTVSGVSTEFAYVYDAAGRLTDTRVDGSTTRHYEYDANGNRTALVSATGTEHCIYDEQDRLLGCGDATYQYNLVGQLERRSTADGAVTTFDYDVLGNLRAVTLPDGRHIDYEIDAKNRRIGKNVDGVRQWGLLYQTDLAPIALVDEHNQPRSIFVYATHKHVPDYMIKDGTTYRFVVDHLGSVRMVVNVVTGQIAQRIDYDEFGVVVADTNPGFQPFGFAGGLYDADTGLTRFGTRDYDPVVGRWTAKDPILFRGGTTNLYEYVNGDPVNSIDPSGLYGTNDCSYYEQRCAESGGDYYCKQAQFWCNWFPKPDDPNPNDDYDQEGFFRCTRQCLQDCDRAENGNQNFCPDEADDRAGPWNPASTSFECHYQCYAACGAAGGLRENPYDPQNPVF